MKKLSVLLLATVFVFGVAAQTTAAVSDLDVSAFTEDPLITFDDFAPDTQCTAITDQYYQDLGVLFSDGLYGESIFSIWTMQDWYTAANFNVCEFTPEDAPAITVTFVPPVTRVGFDGASYAGGITVTVFRDGVATEEVYRDALSKTFVGFEVTAGIDAIEIKGEGDGGLSEKHYTFFIDNFQFGGTPDTGPAEIEVTMDVKPPNCLAAPINMKSRGVTPVVIAGKEDFDVTMIDPDSIELQGISPVRSAVEDVTYCNSPEPDSFLDLTLKFNTEELVEAMGTALTEGGSAEIFLQLTGNLFDGTPIKGEDMVSVKGKAEKGNKGKQKGKK